MLNIVVLRDIMKQKEVEKMKIIKVAAEGINLFKDRIDIDFYAEKRVLADNSEIVSNLFGRFFTNNVISVVGINASGKTSLLRFISFVFNYMNGMSINTISEREVFTDSREISIEVIFYTEEKGLCKLSSKIVRKHIFLRTAPRKRVCGLDCLDVVLTVMRS